MGEAFEVLTLVGVGFVFGAAVGGVVVLYVLDWQGDD